MSFEKPIRRIAVIGTGVIGASWAAQYLARGLDVVASDPAPNAEANLRKYVDNSWEQLEEIGLSPGASRDRLSFTKDSEQALAQADFVQENGPERPDLKTKMFAQMDAATPVDSIIASSSSGITPSVMQSDCKHPERVIVGHPFNPPHIVPLVEVVGGTATSPAAVERAMRFYASIGKQPHSSPQGTAGTRGQSATGRPLSRDAASHPRRRLERRGSRYRCLLRTRAALGRDGPKPTVAFGWRSRRYQPFHGAADGPTGGDDADSRKSGRDARTQENHCRRGYARSRWPLRRRARARRERDNNRTSSSACERPVECSRRERAQTA